jgi:7-cyano-7-deazaguanine synthase
MSDSVAIFSGGLDSTTLVYDLVSKGRIPLLVSFDYGQRHKKELSCARLIANRLGLDHHVVDLSGISNLLATSGSVLVDSTTDVPDGHYSEKTMKTTVVPNRNMIMLAIAAGVAVASNASDVFFGVHSGDHFIYPDCRPAFVEAMNTATILGNVGFGTIPTSLDSDFIKAPFLYYLKADIAYLAFELNVPVEETWSCYKGGKFHCGRCGTCVERLEALHEASTRYYGVSGELRFDPTVYEDKTYWRTVV